MRRLVVCAAFCALGLALPGEARATFLQLHAIEDLQDVGYTWTIWGFPIEVGEIDLTGCEWANIPIPWWATDSWIPPLDGLKKKYCEEKITAWKDDGAGGLEMETFNQFLKGTGGQGVLFPWLGSDNTQLYVGIDLNAYYNAGGMDYSIGQVIDFTNGVSAVAPGFLVGTSSIYINPTTGGWTTDNPYTGQADVVGEQGVCPEPSTLTLAGLGGVGLLALGGRRRGRAGGPTGQRRRAP